MDWPQKKENFLNILTNRLRNLKNANKSKNYNSYLTLDSHIRIPILINKINVTQASTQTLPINFNNNNSNLEDSKSSRTRRRKYQHRFNKCLVELLEKYPPIPPHDSSNEEKSIINNEMNNSIWSKLLESREDLSKLNKTLEDLDKRLEDLSMNICSKCRY